MKTIIELYEEANGWSPAGFDRTVQELERFAALVVASIDPQSSMAWQEGNEAGRLAEREAIRAELTRIVVMPTLTHGILVKLSDVDAAICARGENT